MNENLGVLIGGLALAGIWRWFYVEHRQYMVDYTRQEIFQVRDRLFDQAVKGLVPMESEAYRLVRELLNANIRFLHDLSFIRTLMILGIEYQDQRYRAAIKELQIHLDITIDKLKSESEKELVREATKRLKEAVVLHIVRTSLILSVVFFSLVLVLLCFAVVKHIIGAIQAKTMSALNSEIAKLEGMVAVSTFPNRAWLAVNYEAQLIPS